MAEPFMLQLLKLIGDLSWVALFAYIVNRFAAYSMERLKVYGAQDTMLPPNDMMVTEPSVEKETR